MSLECGECERDARGPHDWECSRASPARVRALEATENYPREGRRLGPGVYVDGEWFTPVLWGGKSEPSWVPTEDLEFGSPFVAFEFDATQDGATVEVKFMRELRKVRLGFSAGPEVRRIVFNSRSIAGLCCVLLREAGVSTFRYSRKTNAAQITMANGADVREVTR